MITGQFKRLDGKPGSIAEILSDIGDFISGELPGGLMECARAIQREIVARAPVKTGQMRDAFASPQAIEERAGGKIAYGLLTSALQKQAYYWTFVEYGTKGRAAQVRGTMGWRGRRIRKNRPAIKARPPHPFVRPGVLAAREQFKNITVNLTGQALDKWRKGK